MLGGVAFATLRTFLADNAVIGLPLGIERVIGIHSFMQNKPNFSNNPMNITPLITRYYEQKPPHRPPAKQTQSNPIKPKQTQFKQHQQPLNHAANCGNLRMIVVL
jgi:hypothetical protein